LLQFALLQQVVDVPVKTLGGAEMARDACPDAARPQRASGIGVPPTRKGDPAETANGNLGGLIEASQQQIGSSF
jgi:hypothetical protein